MRKDSSKKQAVKKILNKILFRTKTNHNINFVPVFFEMISLHWKLSVRILVVIALSAVIFTTFLGKDFMIFAMPSGSPADEPSPGSDPGPASEAPAEEAATTEEVSAGSDEDGNGQAPPSEPDLSSTVIACTDLGSSVLSWVPSAYTSYYNVWRSDGPASATGSGLLGQYFDDKDMSVPIVTRVDPPGSSSLDQFSFNWGMGAPSEYINPETFAVRWTGKIKAPVSGSYTFYINAQDGKRLFINDERVIDKFNTSGLDEIEGKVNLEEGKLYNVRFEYQNTKLNAQVDLKWEIRNAGGSVVIPKQIVQRKYLFPSFANNITPKLVKTGIEDEVKPLMYFSDKDLKTGDGLYAEYFDGLKLDKAVKDPAVSKIDRVFNFPPWGPSTPPDPHVDGTNFSVRWTGKIKAPESGVYTFHITAQDGVRLHLTEKAGKIPSSERIIDKWSDDFSRTLSGTATLLKGQMYDITIEHYHNDEDSEQFKFEWEAKTEGGNNIISREVVPTKYLYRSRNIDLRPGVFARYFDNRDKRGVPSFSRLEYTNLNELFDLNWGLGSPDKLISPDNFSIRWEGKIKTPADEAPGRYTFFVTSPGRVDLEVGKATSFVSGGSYGRLDTIDGKVTLDPDQYYTFKLEASYETGPASLKLEWQKPSQVASGQRSVIPGGVFYSTLISIPTTQKPNSLFSRTYDNRKLNSLVVSDNVLMPDSSRWPLQQPPPVPAGNITPSEYVDPDYYSIRWNGKIKVPENGTYTFFINSDDGVKLVVDKKNIFDSWSKNGPVSVVNKSGTIGNLVAGKSYDFRLEFFEFDQNTNIKLKWKTPSMASNVLPVDIPDSAFTYTSPISSSVLTTTDSTPPGSISLYQVTSVGPGGITPSGWIPVPGGNCAVSTPSSINASCQPPPDQDNIRIEVNWNDVLSASEYHVYRKATVDGVEGPLEDRGYVADPLGNTDTAHQMIDTLDTNTLNPSSETRYFYAVKVIDQTGRGNEGAILPSDWVEVNLPDCSPPVINLSLTNNTTGITQQQNDLPLVAKQNESVAISWNTTNVPIGADSCTASIPSTSPAPPQSLITAWSNAKAQSGNQNLPPISAIGDYQLRLTCSNSQGVSNFSTITLRITQTQKPYIQTTGGDVHTNESIFIPGGNP